MTQTKVSYTPFQGGLDLVSPPLNIPPGYLIDSINYEPYIHGGYRRIAGYERYDGSPSPSERHHVVLKLDSDCLFSVHDLLQGNTSLATGYVVMVEGEFLCLCGLRNEFIQDEIIRDIHGNEQRVKSLDYTDEKFSSYTNDERSAIYEAFYRNNILKPKGVGAVEGVCHYKDVTFAFRAGQDGNVRVSRSGSGVTGYWTEIKLESIIPFENGGYYIPKEGEILSGYVGGRITVSRYVRQGGSADDLSVYGYLVGSVSGNTIPKGDRLEGGKHLLGTIAASGFLAMTVTGVSARAVMPSVGGQIKGQGGATATIQETILTTPTNSPDIVECWFLLSNVTGTFTDGDQILSGTTAIGNIKGNPLPAIRVAQTDSNVKVGDVLEISGNVSRVFWSKLYDDRFYLILDKLLLVPSVNDSVYFKHVVGYAKAPSEEIKIPSGGVFEFRVWNFYAQPDHERIYGCSGTYWAFELNPKTGAICPIITEDDTPVYPHTLEVHKNHLFLGFPGGLVRHSVIGEPMNFNGLLGAFEVGVGDDVTGMVSHPGEVMAIISRNRIQGFYGNGIDDWQMSLIAENTGGFARSIQLFQQAYMLDDNGICQLQRVIEYGNFAESTVSKLVQPLINKYKSQVVGSTVVRDQNLICWYFEDGYGLSLKPQVGKLPEILNFKYPTNISCVHNAEDDNGNTRVFFGTPDGFVYEDRKGTNFDGEPIESFIKTAYDYLKSPTYRKSYKRIELMLTGGHEVTLQVVMQLDYSASYTPQPATKIFSIDGDKGGYWDYDNWNEFYWSGQDVGTGHMSVSGTGKNYSLMIYNNSAWVSPFTLQGYLVHYIMRGLDRG